MRKWTGLVCVFAAWTFSTGCEWTTGGGTDSFNDSYNWVNFSGVYRNQDGGLLVSDFTATTGTDGSTQTVEGEGIGAGDGMSTVHGGVLDHENVVPGTITIQSAGYVFTDANADGVLEAGFPFGSGSIDYTTGAWSINTAGDAIANGQSITASYGYTITGTPSAGPGPGSSGFSIFTLTVHQSGNRITFTDNNGAVFEGNIGSINSTGGTGSDDDSQILIDGETVIAQFTVRGNSAAGVPVTITGTLEGSVNQDDTDFSFTQRRISGTWIEEGTGVTGDVLGVAGPVGLVVPDEGGA